jgi:hypothetical protein
LDSVQWLFSCAFADFFESIGHWISAAFYNECMESATYTTDTSVEAFEVQLECFRRMAPQERIERMSSWSTQLKKMAMEAIRRRHPEFDEQQVQLKYIELAYSLELAQGYRTWLTERAGERSQ